MWHRLCSARPARFFCEIFPIACKTCGKDFTVKKGALFFAFFLFACLEASYSHGIQVTDPPSDYVAGELLVKLKPGANEGELDRFGRKHGVSKIKSLHGRKIQRVAIGRHMSVERARNLYASHPLVEYAEPNYYVELHGMPNDPSLGAQWNLINPDATGTDINVSPAWDIATGDPEVIVAVIDSGIAYDHPDLRENIWVNTVEYGGMPGIDDDLNGYVDDIHGIDVQNHDSDPDDELGHGTHIAGIIGASGNNGLGVVGVNWRVRLLPCKFTDHFGRGNVADTIECLDYIAALKNRGENIVATNNSWGWTGAPSQAIRDAIDRQREILFIASAGNGGRDNEGDRPNFPASYDLPNLISVAALGQNGELADFSNFGRYTVSLAAPGVDIFSTICESSPWGYSWYGTLSGTSMAAPHVTGVAGLIRAFRPDADWVAIRNRILSSGREVAALSRSTLTGKSLDAFAALTCNEKPFISAVDFPLYNVPGEPVVLSAVSIDCDVPAGPVHATLPSGESVEMFDNGVGSDQAAGDGIFSVLWTPHVELRQLNFISPSGTDSAYTRPPFLVTEEIEVAIEHLDYSFFLEVAEGRPPFDFQIVNGALPTGLELDPESGEIHGVPRENGWHEFHIEVRDADRAGTRKHLGIYVEDLQNSIQIVKASYEERRKELSVKATSAYGPVAALQVDAIGPMNWNDRKGIWIADAAHVDIEDISGMVTVSGPEGSVSANVVME